ncbi:MAG: ribosomal protein S18-alanine N-acetyltransferase [Eubacteriales bacterium]
MIQIRPMEEKDLDRVTQLEAENFSTPWKKEDFREILTCDYAHFFVAEAEGIVVATCGLRNIVGEGEITNVVVSKEYREHKIGSKLLEKVLHHGDAWGIKEYTLEVRVSNEAAIKLYERFGFQSEGIRKNFYEKPLEDAMVMWKR